MCSRLRVFRVEALGLRASRVEGFGFKFGFKVLVRGLGFWRVRG